MVTKRIAVDKACTCHYEWLGGQRVWMSDNCPVHGERVTKKVGKMDDKLLSLVLARISWLEQKEKEQRRVGGPDFTGSDLLRGRTQGEIGALKWLLKEMGYNQNKGF